MKTVLEFQIAKDKNKKISMVTCYDYWSAKILEASDVDCLLVGDSVAMVMHGFESPVSATVEMMETHIEAVKRGAPQKLIIGDMPFLSFRKGISAGMEAAQRLMRAGANALKLEGVVGHEDLVEQLVRSGIPVMGHLGLTPQSVNAFGGFKVQGRNQHQAEEIVQHAQRLESLGCFSVVLECIPSSLTQSVQQKLTIPTIGIGAGPDTDGQVLVLQDLLGADMSFQPKFLRRYENLQNVVTQAVNGFVGDVVSGDFPQIKESYE